MKRWLWAMLACAMLTTGGNPASAQGYSEDEAIRAAAPEHRRQYTAYLIDLRRRFSAICYKVPSDVGRVALTVEIHANGRVRFIRAKYASPRMIPYFKQYIDGMKVPPPPKWLPKPYLVGIPIQYWH